PRDAIGTAEPAILIPCLRSAHGKPHHAGAAGSGGVFDESRRPVVASLCETLIRSRNSQGLNLTCTLISAGRNRFLAGAPILTTGGHSIGSRSGHPQSACCVSGAILRAPENAARTLLRRVIDNRYNPYGKTVAKEESSVYRVPDFSPKGVPAPHPGLFA